MNIDFSPPGIHGLACKKLGYHVVLTKSPDLRQSHPIDIGSNLKFDENCHCFIWRNTDLITKEFCKYQDSTTTNFMVIKLILKKILANIYCSNVKFYCHFINGGLVYILLFKTSHVFHVYCPSILLMMNENIHKSKSETALVKYTFSCFHPAAALHFPISSPFPRDKVSCYKCQHTFQHLKWC